MFVVVFAFKFSIQYNVDVICFIYAIEKVCANVIFYIFDFSFFRVKSFDVEIFFLAQSQDYTFDANENIIFENISKIRTINEIDVVFFVFHFIKSNNQLMLKECLRKIIVVLKYEIIFNNLKNVSESFAIHANEFSKSNVE